MLHTLTFLTNNYNFKKSTLLINFNWTSIELWLHIISALSFDSLFEVLSVRFAFGIFFYNKYIYIYLTQTVIFIKRNYSNKFLGLTGLFVGKCWSWRTTILWAAGCHSVQSKWSDNPYNNTNQQTTQQSIFTQQHI